MSSSTLHAFPRPAALLWLAAAMLLGGCGSAPPLVQTVRIPVHTPCIGALPVRPQFATQTLALDASDGEKVLAIARDLPTHLKYESALEAALAGCL